MTNRRALWLVTRREILNRVRSKAFLVSALVTLLLLMAIIVLPPILEGGPRTYQLGVVGDEAIVEAARALGEAETDPEDEPPTIAISRFADVAAGEAALADNDIELLMVDGQALVDDGTSGFSDSELAVLLQRAAGTIRLAALAEESTETAATVVEILTTDPLEVRSLSGVDPSDTTRPFIAYIGLVLMYIAILTYGSWCLMGVTEEKTNRVVEVLLATLQPWHLLSGKVIGLGLLGLVQFGITIGLGYGAARLTNAFDLPALPVDSLVWLIVWFVLGYAIYAVAFGAAGALVSRSEDAQNAAAPMTILAVVGFFVSFRVLDAPEGVLAVIAALFPFTAPFVVPVRLALDAIPPWQVVLSILVMAGAIVVLIRLAARVYAGGLLRFGARVKIREAWRGAG